MYNHIKCHIYIAVNYFLLLDAHELSEVQDTPANNSAANDQDEDKPTGEKLKCCMSMNNFIAPTGS